MSSREDNERVVRRGFEAFNVRDFDSLERTVDAGIETHVEPPLVNPGTWHGRDGFRKTIDAWLEAFEWQTDTVLSLEHPDDHHVIAEVNQAGVGAGSGVEVEMQIAFLFEIREGMIVRLHLYPDRESAVAALA